MPSGDESDRSHPSKFSPDAGGADVMLIRTTLIAAARGRPITVVVLTGEAEPAWTRAREAGAAVIFAKPCHWEEVLTYLDRQRVAPAA